MLGSDRGDKFARCSESDNFAVIHDGDPIAKPLRFIHVVRGEQDGPCRQL